MYQIGAPLVGSYDHYLVGISILIAISASYAALDLGGRVTAARGWVRSAWLAGGATTLGFGIWSMHFTGMLAFNLPVPVAYDWLTVLLSLFAAIFASAVALYVVSRKKMDRIQALTGSVVMGLAIAGMHYIGMAAMRLSAVCVYSPPLVAASVLIAVIASLAALLFTFDYREHFRGTTLARVISAVVMGAAISLMHYTGMMSATFFPTTVPTELSHAVNVSSLGLGGIAICTLVVQGVAILTSSVDRRFALQAKELQTSERFRQVADILRDVLLLSNADFSEVLFVNRAYETIWGRSAESLYASPRSWLEGVHADDRQQVQEAILRLGDGKPLDYVECRVIRPDGSVSWVRLRVYPIVDPQGHPYRIVGTVHEFTMRKLAEEQVKRGAAYLAMAQKMAKMGVWSWNLSSGDMFGSQELYRIFDFDPAETKLTRELFLQRIHPEDRSRYESEISTAVAERINWELDYRIVCPDGSFKYIQGIGQPVFNISGDLLEFVGTAVDISDRKEVEEALRTSEREQRQIAAQLERERARLVEAQEVAKMGSWEAELPSLNVIWSEQTHRIFETDPSRFHPTRPRFVEFIHPEDRAKVDAAFEASLETSAPSTVQYRIVMPDGRVKILEERWQTFHNEEGKPARVAGTCRDITERVQAEEEFQRLSGKLLRSQDEERRRIARDLHDSTGQDLVALATMLSQLSSSIPSTKRKERRLLSEGKALADKCIREVRTLSYLLHPPALDQAGLGAAIRDYVDGFTKRSGIQVELELSPRLGRMAGDIEQAVFRVVQEALTNVQRHSGSQRAKIRVNRNSNLTLEITDFGRGLSTAKQRGKEEDRLEVGVGIPSMQERVKLTGGRFEIDSSSQGTTIRVTIPLSGEPT